VISKAIAKHRQVRSVLAMSQTCVMSTKTDSWRASIYPCLLKANNKNMSIQVPVLEVHN